MVCSKRVKHAAELFESQVWIQVGAGGRVSVSQQLPRPATRMPTVGVGAESSWAQTTWWPASEAFFLTVDLDSVAGGQMGVGTGIGMAGHRCEGERKSTPG